MFLKKYENIRSVEKLVFIYVILGVIIFLFLYNCLLLYLIKKFYKKENIIYKDYILSWKIMLIKFFIIIYLVLDVIGIVENNIFYLEIIVIIIDKGKEKEE